VSFRRATEDATSEWFVHLNRQCVPQQFAEPDLDIKLSFEIGNVKIKPIPWSATFYIAGVVPTLRVMVTNWPPKETGRKSGHS
jgi:hypothetical protein